MTFLLASVGRDCGFISQDGAASMALPGQVARMSAVLAGGPVSREFVPEPPILWRRARKVLIWPSRNFAVGFSGLTWAFGLLTFALAFRCRDFDAFEKKIAGAWAFLPAYVRSKPLTVFAVGWSAKRDRVAGIICNSADGMVPEPFIDSHAFGQEIASGFPESAEADAMSDASLDAVDLPRFHRLAATVVTRQSRAGQLGGIAVGGRLQTVRVDRLGARIVAEADLDALAAFQ